MSTYDIVLTVKFWFALFGIGVIAYPFTSMLFTSWWDRGYLFSKAVGMILVTYIVWILAMFHILPFTVETILFSSVLVLGIGIILPRAIARKRLFEFPQTMPIITINSVVILVVEEMLFFGLLLFWAWVKGHEPSIHGLEKFMDFGFTKSILNSLYFPPPDMWYSGGMINYYYFGHLALAVLTRLSGVNLVYTFSIMLAALFSFCFTMSFSIGYQLIRSFQLSAQRMVSTQQSTQQIRGKWRMRDSWVAAVLGALLIGYLVSMAGNMQTIYAFTRGYPGEDVKPFWEISWPIAELPAHIQEGMNSYWYANATRFIPFTIHEFPSYSFVVSDLHGHVLSIPFALLAIALLLVMFSKQQRVGRDVATGSDIVSHVFYGLLIAAIFMTNALDGPIYSGLFVFLLIFERYRSDIPFHMWIQDKLFRLSLVATAGIFVLPFIANFRSFVTGLAVNCPPKGLAEKTFGPIIFETVDKCQKSPFWMMWLLWGFFWFTGMWLFRRQLWVVGCRLWVWIHSTFRVFRKLTTHNIQHTTNQAHPYEWILLMFFVYSILLIIFPEFFYFKDIYPAHFRSNTMFKLGYQAFMMYSIIAGYSIVKTLISRFEIRHSAEASWGRRDSRFGIQDKNQHQSSKYESQNAKYEPRITNNQKHSLILRAVFLILVVPQLFLVSWYPYFSVRSYFNSLTKYDTLDGFKWLRTQYPDNAAVVDWLNEHAISDFRSSSHQSYCALRDQFGFKMLCPLSVPVIVEADGDSYTDYLQVSAFTGLPAVMGWPVHEWLWRGSYDFVAPRRDDIRIIYENEDVEATRTALEKYDVSYVIVGHFEREKFTALKEAKFNELGTSVFSVNNTTIYKINRKGGY